MSLVDHSQSAAISDDDNIYQDLDDAFLLLHITSTALDIVLVIDSVRKVNEANGAAVL